MGKSALTKLIICQSFIPPKIGLIFDENTSNNKVLKNLEMKKGPKTVATLRVPLS